MKDLSKVWAARDEDGTLFLYRAKPLRCEEDNQWSIGEGSDELMEIDPNLLPEVTFENSPQLIDLSITTKEKKEYNLFVGKDSFGGIMVFKTLPVEVAIPGDFKSTSLFDDGTGAREIPFAELANELDYGEVLPMKVIIG
jgi:hypothetical protein